MTGGGPCGLWPALDATWPPAGLHRVGPWTLREGRGGGSRVSTATADRPATEADVAQAEAGMRAMGQAPLFRIGPGQDALDALLAARGYEMFDPVVIYAADLPLPGGPDAEGGSHAVWPPLGIQSDIWREGGIGAERQAIMARAPGPKAAILGRRADRPAGTAFVAIREGVAVLHAVEVRAELRRCGVGRGLVLAAARWAARQGADRLALAVTRANAPARALYAGLGFHEAGGYHYRAAPAAGARDRSAGL
ncbi:MAG: GNAT family N-acetyltransferase [Tranquillimonas sp.]